VDPKAVQVISNNASNGSTVVARANLVMNAARHMEEVMSKLQSINQSLIDQARQVGDLSANKSTWPALLRMVHLALPRDNELNEAIRKGPEAYKQKIASNPDAYARNKRKQVFITGFKAQYTTDLTNEFRKQKEALRPTPGGAQNTPLTGAETSSPTQPGFIIVLSGRTPNAGGYDFLKKEFFSGLEKAKDKDPPMYVSELALIDCYQLKVDKSLTAGGAAKPAGGYGGGFGGAPATQATRSRRRPTR